ncbi:type I restriction-modification system endonuclease [Paenactinomyces guangxiensis]|uniref:type I restriction-modification system endonuclease n=1 Tax=Paenactinomyces guangxiensis TaxID=1490290 RepID=UPI003A8E3919
MYRLGYFAEKYLYTDPNTSITKLRQFGETMAKMIIAKEKLNEQPTQHRRLRYLEKEGYLNKELYNLFNTLRLEGNGAVHEATFGTVEDAKSLLPIAFRLAVWYMKVYMDHRFKPPVYRVPEPVGEIERELTPKEMIELLERELQLSREQAEQTTEEERKIRARVSQHFIQQLRLSEAETRTVIDAKLREAGWEADTKNLTYQNGTRPQKNRNIAIAEWPVQGGRADYALFIGMQLVGLIEAKSIYQNVPSVLDSQTKTYARHVVQHEDEIITSTTGEYKVPFLYATNGRPYLRQFEESSGIWFWDSRRPTRHSRALESWHSPDDLKALLAQNTDEAARKLDEEEIDCFGLRDYQKEAVLAVEKAITKGERKMLVAMATGTGKTRMSIALMYRLLKAKMCRRILFLVDRNALGQQTEDALKEMKIKDLLFSEIYDVKSLDDVTPAPETKVHIATVQGMVRRLFYQEGQPPSVGQYDFIIVDEAHRGYTHDREMTEEEILFRDQQDYINQYRRVVEYFDAAVLGLTATPALHTIEIFGHPIFEYSYSEAVLDGYLVDHEVPYRFQTELQQLGIKLEKGKKVKYLDTRTEQIRKEKLKDTLSFDVEQFNKKVITESFNRVILERLTDYIDPHGKEKTLIFAVNDRHADMVVRLLKEAYQKNGDEIEDDAIMKITRKIYQPSNAIKRFKNERLPNIVVTVDLLTTGIDIPAISNLVFMRQVRSRILYEQMLGRATRLCPEIGKTCFRIYDAVGIYDKLESYSDMKPLVKKTQQSLREIYDAFTSARTKAEREFQRRQLIGKLQRLKQRFTDEKKQEFKEMSKGKSVDQWIKSLKNRPLSRIKEDASLIEFIEQLRLEPRKIYISKQKDHIREVTRGFGNGNERPEDYLEGFRRYIKENMNKVAALQVVCTRPQDLTREDLRELVRILEMKGFKQTHLQTAWKQTKKEEIAADLISFIRQAALGDALVDQETRIKRAMRKVYAMNDWTPRQRQWLERIEKQLLQMPVLDPNPQKAFTEEPFKSAGGYQALKRAFGDSIDQIVRTINKNLYIS